MPDRPMPVTVTLPNRPVQGQWPHVTVCGGNMKATGDEALNRAWAEWPANARQGAVAVQ